MVVSLILPEHAITNFVNSGSVALIKVSSFESCKHITRTNTLACMISNPMGHCIVGTELNVSTISVFCLSLTTGVHSFQLDR